MSRDGSIQPGPPPVPRVKRPHVATEYAEKGGAEGPDVAAQLVRDLRRPHRVAVLGYDPFALVQTRPIL